MRDTRALVVLHLAMTSNCILNCESGGVFGLVVPCGGKLVRKAPSDIGPSMLKVCHIHCIPYVVSLQLHTLEYVICTMSVPAASISGIVLAVAADSSAKRRAARNSDIPSYKVCVFAYHIDDVLQLL